MKTRLTLSLFSLLVVLFILPGNRTGRASFSGNGNTGAPGDQTEGGSPFTCMNCHDDNAFNPSVSVSVLDSANNAVTHYRPGRLYTAQVTIAATGAAGYGFQMIALRDTGNIDLDGFTDINPNNYKLSTINNGRTYAEHPTMSVSNTFNVRWTAPVTGTGSVTFYAAGNAVNNNNGSSGDGAAITSLKLFEEITLSSDESPDDQLGLRVFPNPVADAANLYIDVLKNTPAQMAAYDLSGNVVWVSQTALQAGNNRLHIPTAHWPAGTYLLQVKGVNMVRTVKILKL